MNEIKTVVSFIDKRKEAFDIMADELYELIARESDENTIRQHLDKMSDPVVEIALSREMLEDIDDYMANKLAMLKEMLHKKITYH